MPKNNGKARREERRNSAYDRMREISRLTPQQRLDRLDSVNMVATRERARLQRFIDEQAVSSKPTKKQRTEAAAEQEAKRVRNVQNAKREQVPQS